MVITGNAVSRVQETEAWDWFPAASTASTLMGCGPSAKVTWVSKLLPCNGISLPFTFTVNGELSWTVPLTQTVDVLK